MCQLTFEDLRPASKEVDPVQPLLPDLSKNEAVRWILNCSVGDSNWESALRRLTQEEIGYCLVNEKRKSVINKLNAQKRRLVEGS